MKKLSKNTKIFAGFQVVGWTVVIIFMLWLCSGCSGGGSSSYVAPPPCVNEVIPSFEEDWEGVWYAFETPYDITVYLTSSGEVVTYDGILLSDGVLYAVQIQAWVDDPFTASISLIYFYLYPGKWHEAEGEIKVCNDFLTVRVDWVAPSTKTLDVYPHGGEIEGENPTILE